MRIQSMFRSALLGLISTVVVSQAAFAITPKEVLDGRAVRMPHIFRGLEFVFDSRYQIGEEWGKKPVTQLDLESDPNLKRMALATARIRSGGTGFYIGRYNGRHVIATNHHVCPSAFECSGQGVVHFPLLNNARLNQLEFYGSWPEIDLALFAVTEPSEELAAELAQVASPLSFDEHLEHGQELVTIGFGGANNPQRQMVANRDSDCVVYSGDGEYRLMADPDDLNPGPYKAWSFANGCDVSHGDSGSAMMNRDTGRVIGIIWTGRIPKDPKVQSAQFMRNLLVNPTEEVWTQLSYGVPAVHMKAYISDLFVKGEIAPEHALTIRSILDGKSE
jgi:S1-C subfamily serine protease